jgi:hypothetical protein
LKPADGQNMTETCSVLYEIKYHKLLRLTEIYNLLPVSKDDVQEQ